MTETNEPALFMCIKDGGPLYQGDAPMVFEDVGDAQEVRDGVGEGFVAEIEPGIVMRRLREAGITHVYYQPSGLRPATMRAIEELEDDGKPQIRREMMRLVARGEAVYDPETDRYAPRHVVDEEVARGEAAYDPETGVYRQTKPRGETD